MRNASDLFAVASHLPLDAGALRARLEMPALPAPLEIELQIVNAPAKVLAGSCFQVRVRLANGSAFDLKSREPHPVHFAYHCYSEQRECVVFDGRRTRLPAVKTGRMAEFDMEIEAPAAGGCFLFRLTLVQEGVRWFDAVPQNLFADQWIQVAPR